MAVPGVNRDCHRSTAPAIPVGSDTESAIALEILSEEPRQPDNAEEVWETCGRCGRKGCSAVAQQNLNGSHGIVAAVIARIGLIHIQDSQIGFAVVVEITGDDGPRCKSDSKNRLTECERMAGRGNRKEHRS